MKMLIENGQKIVQKSINTDTEVKIGQKIDEELAEKLITNPSKMFLKIN